MTRSDSLHMTHSFPLWLTLRLLMDESLWLIPDSLLIHLLTDDHSARLLILTHTLTDAPLSHLLYILSDSDLLHHSTSPPVFKDELWVSMIPRSVLAIIPLLQSQSQLSSDSCIVTHITWLLQLSSLPFISIPELLPWKTGTRTLRTWSQIPSPQTQTSGPSAVITTYAAKETIGNTPAPSVPSQFSWKHLAPLPGQSPFTQTFKSNP